MLEIAGGRLYWSLERALYTDVNYILIAKAGHDNMLRSIFGGDETTKGPPKGADGKPLVLTPAAFDAIFAQTPPETREVRRK